MSIWKMRRRWMNAAESIPVSNLSIPERNEQIQISRKWNRIIGYRIENGYFGRKNLIASKFSTDNLVFLFCSTFSKVKMSECDTRQTFICSADLCIQRSQLRRLWNYGRFCRSTIINLNGMEFAFYSPKRHAIAAINTINQQWQECESETKRNGRKPRKWRTKKKKVHPKKKVRIISQTYYKWPTKREMQIGNFPSAFADYLAVHLSSCWTWPSADTTVRLFIRRKFFVTFYLFIIMKASILSSFDDCFIFFFSLLCFLLFIYKTEFVHSS